MENFSSESPSPTGIKNRANSNPVNAGDVKPSKYTPSNQAERIFVPVYAKETILARA
jgi:hypothetical protein